MNPSRAKGVVLAMLTVWVTQLAHVHSQDRFPSIEYVNKRTFRLPYDVRDTERRTDELRLFASLANGPWEQVSRIKPTEKGFDVRLDRDGSYTFAVQRIYDGGQYDVSPRNLQPALSLYVDTQPPRANLLRPMIDKDGSPGIEWEIVDETLNESSVQLEYRWSNSDSWLPFDARAKYRAKGSQSWEIKREQKLQVRIRATDLAKNEYVSPGIWTPPQQNDPNRIDGPRETFGATNNSGAFEGNPATNPAIGSRNAIFYVNSTKVNLNYDVKIGPSGLSRLELYTTTNGADWKLDEKASLDFTGKPMMEPVNANEATTKTLQFVAPTEGLFGFIIIAKSRAGLGEPPPRKGEPPRVQVMVDTTKPKVRIQDIKVRPNGDRGGAILEIFWEASDANLAPQPIDIEYAADANAAEWKLMADKLDNTGRFTWSVPMNEHYQFYVRIRARDRATNVGEAKSDRPVIVDLTVPSVDIKDVTPGP